MKYPVPLDPGGGELPGDDIELLQDFFEIGDALRQDRLSYTDQRVLVRRFYRICAELPRRRRARGAA